MRFGPRAGQGRQTALAVPLPLQVEAYEPAGQSLLVLHTKQLFACPVSTWRFLKKPREQPSLAHVLPSFHVHAMHARFAPTTPTARLLSVKYSPVALFFVWKPTPQMPMHPYAEVLPLVRYDTTPGAPCHAHCLHTGGCCPPHTVVSL